MMMSGMSGRLLPLLTQYKLPIPVWSCHYSTLVNSQLPSLPLSCLLAPCSSVQCLSTSSDIKSSSGTVLPSSNVSNVGSSTSKALGQAAGAKASLPTDQQKISIQMEYGLPHLTVTLPSRNEQCVFVLRPVTHTVGDLVDMLQQEDAGIDRVVVKNHQGVRIAATTIIQHLLEESSFELVINDRSYVADQSTMINLRPSLTVQGMTGLPSDELQQVNDVKSFIGRLYEVKLVVLFHKIPSIYHSDSFIHSR